jgi:VCBS repeat-containing protein
VLINEPVSQNPNGTITVTGTGEQGANVEVKDVNNVLVGTATVLPNGTWSLNSVGEVPAGQLTAKSTNLNQQITTDTAPYNNTPVAVQDVAQGTEDSTTLTGDVSTNDTHKDGSETYQLTSSAAGSHGTLAFNPNGAWTYTRTANLEAIQTAVIDTFTYKVTDAAGKESTAQLKITLDPVNDAPEVTYSTVQKATYFENADPVVAISAPLVLSDVDSANLSGATVRVANFSTPNAFMPGDLLSFTLPANSTISGVYDTNTGILTFTGVASVAQYQDALRSVKYAHNKDDYETDGNRKVFWTVTDEGGLASSNPPFSWIVVKKLNDAPVLLDTDLALPDIQPLSTESLPTDASKYGLGITTNLLVGGVSDADGLGVTKGIAIVGVNTSMGTLYLSSDGGETWATPGFEVSASNAILLKSQANRRIYFQPHVGVEATIADALTIRAWDTSNNVVESVNGLQVLGYPITAVGGTSPYSSTTDTVSLTVATLASAPAFNGTADGEVINGSIGADVILAKGGIDQINADDGHDKIVVNASNVQSLSLSNAANLDGGTGINTLKLTGADMFLDLTNVTVQSKVNNFSALDITGNGANTLKLDLPTVQGLSVATDNPATASVDESKMLVVQANQGDAVVLENTRNWASLSGLSGESLTTLYGPEYGFIANHKYTQFSQNGATLFVDELAPVGDIVGTSGNDTLTGNPTADVIYGNGGVDTIAADAGKDMVILTASSLTALAASTNAATVDGEADINTLKLSGNNLNLDLTNATVMGKLDNFNVIDMKQGAGNKFKLGLNDVLALAGGTDNAATVGVDESKMLVLQGNGGAALNTLQLVDSVNWTTVTNLGGTGLQNTYGPDFGFEAGRSYTQYTNGLANLFVDESLLQTLS